IVANALPMKIINENIPIINGPKPVDQANFVNTKLSSYNVKNRSLTERRILADLEIKGLLKKLGLINPSLADKWCQFFNNCSIEIIESNLIYLDDLIFYELHFNSKITIHKMV
ncbi:35790_t:CDS:1, partial [Gigaspora margarita]